MILVFYYMANIFNNKQYGFTEVDKHLVEI